MGTGVLEMKKDDLEEEKMLLFQNRLPKRGIILCQNSCSGKFAMLDESFCEQIIFFDCKLYVQEGEVDASVLCVSYLCPYFSRTVRDTT